MEVREKIEFLPTGPGVYRFLDSDGVVIYVGKAKNLKKRVSQYFRPKDQLDRKTQVMVSKIDDLIVVEVESERDALLLENNLIKELQPKYNILLKDGKTYPWICIKNELFPRVFITRRYVKDGSKFYGPYSSSNHAHNLIQLINSLFKLRDCKNNFTQELIDNHHYKPCLNLHIHKCGGVCVGKISQQEYDDQIAQIVTILKGDVTKLIREFKQKMLSAASELNFELAQDYKQRIELLENHYSKSLVVNPAISDVDVFTLIFDGVDVFGNFLRIQSGAIIQSLNVEYKMRIEESQESVLTLFMGDILTKTGSLSKEIIVPFLPDNDFEGHTLHIPQRGDKLSLLELSRKNAAGLKFNRAKQEEVLRPQEHREKIVARLQEDLGMNVPPTHIECFDNSNIQGTNPVASCVVFKDGVPSKKDYRHFNIKTVIGANDFASMKEVLNRRYSRLLAENEPLPQLVVVDGGKGQLHCAVEALDELGLLDRIKVIGLAKRLEEIIIPGDNYPLFLDKNSSSLKVLMHLRDEAHRFGITHHRNRRSKGQINSILREIPSIGEKRETELLKRFKSVAQIRKASLEDLTAVVGQKAALAIKEHLK